MLLREIIQEARNLTKAERLVPANHFRLISIVSGLVDQLLPVISARCRCSVFLVDSENNELVAKVFDGDIQEKQVGCGQPRFIKNGYLRP